MEHQIFSIPFYTDENRRVLLGEIKIFLTRCDILFSIFKYWPEKDRFVDMCIPGLHFYIGGNFDFIEKMDTMLRTCIGLIREQCFIDTFLYDSMKEYIDYEKIYFDCFSN